MSDKTSGQCFECCWRQCEASLFDRLINWQSINNTSKASVSQWGGLIPTSSRSVFFFLLSIYSSSLFHNLVFLLEEQHVSNYLRAIHYTWHPPHCTAEIFGVQKKIGFAFTLCSSVLMKREIEGRKAFIFWQNATPGHEYLLLLSDYLPCEESVKGSWSCLREHSKKVWSAAVNHLEEALTTQVTWDKLITPQKKDQTHRLHNVYTTTAQLLCISISVQWRTILQNSQRSRRVILCGNSCGNQTASCLLCFQPEIKYTYSISPQWRAIFTSC